MGSDIDIIIYWLNLSENSIASLENLWLFLKVFKIFLNLKFKTLRIMVWSLHYMKKKKKFFLNKKLQYSAIQWILESKINFLNTDMKRKSENSFRFLWIVLWKSRKLLYMIFLTLIKYVRGWILFYHSKNTLLNPSYRVVQKSEKS